LEVGREKGKGHSKEPKENEKGRGTSILHNNIILFIL
jgi:hypothetical protein